jgi:cell division septum initiation protein DivIVA
MDTLLSLLDRLEAVLLRGASVPLSDKRIVDAQEVLGLLRMIRSHLPAELHRAQRLREEAEALHQRATDEARRVILEAEGHARRLVDEGAVLAEAARRRGEILSAAEADAARVRRGAEEYAARVLADLEAQLLRILGAIQRGKTLLETVER